MARRPLALTRWAYDPPAGRLIEPTVTEQTNGWNTNDEPPAQYFNWMFHTLSGWADFLRGASQAKWQSDTLPYDTSVLTSASLAVDSVTVESTSLIKRNVIAAVDGGGNCVYTTVRAGNATSWVRRTNFTASGTFWRAFFCGPSGSERFWICVDHASAGVLLTTAANSAVLSGTGSWAGATLPGGTKGVRAVAYDGSAYWAAVARDTILATPNASPTSWTAATLGTAVTGVFRDLVWTGTAFLAVTNQGEVYRASGGSAAAATWTALSAMPTGAADWRLTVGPDGTVLAWVENLGAAADFYLTDDDGSSWTAITSSPSVERIKSITFADSVWMAATVEAPYVWQSNDATAWTRLKLPYAGSTTVFDVAYSEGSWLAVRDAYVEVSARAEDIAQGTWAADPTTSSLSNAGWFRGRALSETAPTNGQVYAWNSSTSKWTPTTISGGATALAGLSDIGTMGEPIAQADDLSEVLTAMGGASALRASILGPFADGMAGTGWSSLTASGGGSASWGSSKLTLDCGAGSASSCGVEYSDYLTSGDYYDIAIRLDVTSGDASSDTRISLVAGQDSANSVNLTLWTNGTLEIGYLVASSYTSYTVASVGDIDSTARTGGELWLRISRTPSGVAFLWGINAGTTGAVPTKWSLFYDTNYHGAAVSYAGAKAGYLASNGRYVQITALTLAAVNLDVEVLAIRQGLPGAFGGA